MNSLRDIFRLCALLSWLSSLAAWAEPPRRVLILHSFGRDFAPFDEVAHEFRTELVRRCPQPVEILDASLEMARFDGVEKDGPLLEFLTAMFAERPPDLLVPIGAPAALFFHRHRGEFFPQTPVLVAGADRRRLDVMEAEARFVAMGVDLDLKPILENILRALPGTRHVHVLMGVAPLERFWEDELKREWPPLAPQVTFHWLSDQPMERMRETVRNLPPDSAIFFGVLNRDAAGVTHAFGSGLATIHKAAGAPMFGFSEQQFGLGIVGGRLLPMRTAGGRAAEAAVQLLAGTPPAEVRGGLVPLSAPIYDWRELRRWKIPESRLPAGSTVRFRPASLWQTHRTTVLVTLGVVAIQSTLIALLLAAHRRARESDAGLRLTTEATNIGLWHRNVGAMEEIHASSEWRALFGLPENGPIKTEEVIERIHPDDRTAVRRSMEEAGKDGRNFDIEHRVIAPNGAVRWIASRGRADQAGAGRTLGVSMDITDRKRAEAEVASQREELAHLSRVAVMGEMTASLAHELNQPLTAIVSNANAGTRFLASGTVDPGEFRELLRDISEDGERAGDVIRSIRGLVRKSEPVRTDLSLNEIVEAVLRLARADTLARECSVQAVLASALPWVRADAVQLQQVLLNLLRNAFDAMQASAPLGRRVIVSTSCNGDGSVHLSVRDFGPGLSEEARKRAFEQFFSTKKDGMGMGLAISRSIIAAHGGELTAENAEDGGARFTFTLPADGPVPAADPARPTG